MRLVYKKSGKPVQYGDSVRFGPTKMTTRTYHVRRASEVGSGRVLIMQGGYGCRVRPESIGMEWVEGVPVEIGGH